MSHTGSDDVTAESKWGWTERGVSDILGTLALISLVVMVAAVVIGIGGYAVQQSQADAEISQAENAFAELDARASTVALGEGSSQQTITLGLNNQQQKQMDVVSESVHINISTPDREIMDATLGAIVYTHNGTEIVYQSGGVWKRNLNSGHTALLSPPDVKYDDATLTMPLVNIENEDGRLSGDELTFTRGTSTVPERASEPINSEVVTVTVQSKYYEEWGEYFETHVDGRVDTQYDHAANTVEVELGLSGDIYGSFDSAIVAGGDVLTGNNGKIYGPVISTGDVDGNVGGDVKENVDMNLQTLDPYIDALLADGEENYEDLGRVDSSMTLGEGRYYAEEIMLESHDRLVLDVEDGPITLVVDGDVVMNNSANIHVTEDAGTPDFWGWFGNGEDENEDDNHARLLTNDDFRLESGGPSVTTDDGPQQFQLYGGSNSNVLISQKADFKGVVYAPSEDTTNDGGNIRGGGSKCHKTDYDICIGANSSVYGAIVGGSTMVGQGAELQYDEELTEFEPKVGLDAAIRPRLLHLHVSVNNVSVKSE